MQELSIDQQARVRLAVTDRAGNPARIDGEPVWSSSDEALLLVEVNPDDSMAAFVIPADGAADSTADVRVEVDADLGDGVQPLIGVLNVAITGGAARFVELQVEAVEQKAEA